MKPPAPNPVSGLSTANEASTAPTAASTALPPARSAAAPASALSGCPAAITPDIYDHLPASDFRRIGSELLLAWQKLGDVDPQGVAAAALGLRRAAAAHVFGAADRRLGVDLGGAARGAAIEASG